MGICNFSAPASAVIVCLWASASAAQTFGSAMADLEQSFATLISAVSVNTAQVSATGGQIAMTAMKASEANATALAQFEVRRGLSDAVRTYSVGRDQTNAACGPVQMRQLAIASAARNEALGAQLSTADSAFLENNGDAAMVQSTLNRRRAEFYCSQEEFDAGLCTSLAGVGYNTGPGGGDTNASLFMSGGATGAEEVATGFDYIDRVAPLPTVVSRSGAASAIARMIAQQQAAEASMAREIISGSIMEGLQ